MILHIKRPNQTVYEAGYYHILCDDKRKVHTSECATFYKATCLSCARKKYDYLISIGDRGKADDLKIRFKI